MSYSITAKRRITAVVEWSTIGDPGGLCTPVPTLLRICCGVLPAVTNTWWPACTRWHWSGGHLCQLTYFYCRLCILRCSFLILIVFNNRCEGLMAISTCERGTVNYLLRQAHCERLSTITVVKKGTLEKILAKDYCYTTATT